MYLSTILVCFALLGAGQTPPAADGAAVETDQTPEEQVAAMIASHTIWLVLEKKAVVYHWKEPRRPVARHPLPGGGVRVYQPKRSGVVKSVKTMGHPLHARLKSLDGNVVELKLIGRHKKGVLGATGGIVRLHTWQFSAYDKKFLKELAGLQKKIAGKSRNKDRTAKEAKP